ncbi:MAG: WecB/TagA/CpsF family glycosyltransferase [Synergistales bacterium]|nr:WecB/TagA/CpsF family glycosyltransferase [Synergistales bacterium]
MFSDITLLAGLSISLSVALACLVVQKMLRRHLQQDQLDYMRDLLLLGAWCIIGFWSTSGDARHVVAIAVVATLIGLVQRFSRANIRFLYLVIGLLFAVLGPRISFIGLPGGEYLYLSPWASMLVTALWGGLFPLLVQELDQISGMAAHLLAMTWLLLVGVTLFSMQGFGGSLLLSVSGLILLAVFWSRHGHMFRRLGQPLSALWGTLLAGTSMLGVSKSVAFTTIFLLPVGLFALPFLETSLNAISRALPGRRDGTLCLYRHLLGKGVDHPAAVRAVALFCGALGLAAAALQLRPDAQGLLVAGSSLAASGAYLLHLKTQTSPPLCPRRPVIWGVPIDNVSVQYALAKVRSWLNAGERGPRRIVTPNALAVYACLQDRRLRRVFQSADLSLPDGMGLVWALRAFRYILHERIAGVEFMDRLCRIAATEGWSVFLLGGEPGIAETTGERLQERYPGLAVAGTYNGYFPSEQNDEVVERIRDSRADILFVALGVPWQDIWLYRHIDELGDMVGMGVGGSFDVISGKLRRAPAMWQKLGCEWLYRLFQEPWRWRRMSRLPLFVLAVLATRIGILHKGGGKT